MKRIIIPLLISIASVSLVFVFFENIETYFHDVLSNSKEDINRFALLSFVILASDIILPVPSSIVMFMNGLVLGVVSAFFISLTASLLSSLLGYYIGKKTSFNTKDVDGKASRIISKYGNLALIVSRGIPILSESISYTAGFNKLKIKNYIIFNIIGYIPVCLIYSLFGAMGKGENMFLISFSLSILISGLIWFFGKSFLMSKHED
jgi:uncharacterized membrane protein YdjX (TVP38/TMEM64 family)